MVTWPMHATISEIDVSKHKFREFTEIRVLIQVGFYQIDILKQGNMNYKDS